MSYCPYNVTDSILANCICHPSYTSASDFKPTHTCSDLKGVKEASLLGEMVLLSTNLASTLYVMVLYFKWKALGLWCKSAKNAQETEDLRSFSNNMTIFMLATLIAALALVEKIIAYVDSIQNPAVGILLTVGFSIQVMLERQYISLMEPFIGDTGVPVARDWRRVVKFMVIFFGAVASLTLLLFQFADLRFSSPSDKWINALIVYSITSGLAILLSLILIVYIWDLLGTVSKSDKAVEKTSNIAMSYRILARKMVNNLVFLSLRVVVLVVLLILLGLGPANYQMVHTLWFVSTIIFVHLLQATSLEKIVTSPLLNE